MMTLATAAHNDRHASGLTSSAWGRGRINRPRYDLAHRLPVIVTVCARIVSNLKDLVGPSLIADLPRTHVSRCKISLFRVRQPLTDRSVARPVWVFAAQGCEAFPGVQRCADFVCKLLRVNAFSVSAGMPCFISAAMVFGPV